MPTITTCGPEHRRTVFSYNGNAALGITIKFNSGDFLINAETIQNVLNHFKGQQVRGGFSMVSPTPGGVGEYLVSLGKSMTPRHASFLCAVLHHEGKVVCSLDSNAVVVKFQL